MIWDNPILDRMVEKETFAHIIGWLTPSETTVALLRADGLDDQEIADALGITRGAVYERMNKAMERITQMVPDTCSILAGRNRHNTSRRSLTRPEEEDMVSVGDAARMLSCCSQTVRNWIAAGRFPHAQQAPAGQWQIPWGDLQRHS
jgi:predicted DNA-binding protein (UPF0251 family)